MSKVLGNVKIKVNGDLCKTIGDSVDFEPGGYETEEVMADDGFNYREKPIGSRLTCKFAVSDRTQLKNLNDLREGQIEIITDISTSWTMTNATRMGTPLKVSSSDGTVAFEAMGDPVQLP